MDDISSKNNARHSIVEEDFGEAIQNIIKDLLETISVTDLEKIILTKMKMN